MEKELFDDLITSLNEAIEYEKGDTTKARSTIVTIYDDINIKYNKLPEEEKQAIMILIDKLLIANSR